MANMHPLHTLKEKSSRCSWAGSLERICDITSIFPVSRDEWPKSVKVVSESASVRGWFVCLAPELDKGVFRGVQEKEIEVSVYKGKAAVVKRASVIVWVQVKTNVRNVKQVKPIKHLGNPFLRKEISMTELYVRYGSNSVCCMYIIFIQAAQAIWV